MPFARLLFPAPPKTASQPGFPVNLQPSPVVKDEFHPEGNAPPEKSSVWGRVATQLVAPPAEITSISWKLGFEPTTALILSIVVVTAENGCDCVQVELPEYEYPVFTKLLPFQY